MAKIFKNNPWHPWIWASCLLTWFYSAPSLLAEEIIPEASVIDPMRPARTPAAANSGDSGSEDSDSDSAQDLRVDFIRISATTRMARVGGQWVHPGDHLGLYQVRAIEKDHILMMADGTELKIPFPMPPKQDAMSITFKK